MLDSAQIKKFLNLNDAAKTTAGISAFFKDKLGKTTDDGVTPLMIAIEMQNKLAIDFLLSKGENPYYRSQKGESAVSIAAYTSNDMLCHLKLRGIDINHPVASPQHQSFPIEDLLEQRKYHAVRFLIENGARYKFNKLPEAKDAREKQLQNNFVKFHFRFKKYELDDTLINFYLRGILEELEKDETLELKYAMKHIESTTLKKVCVNASIPQKAVINGSLQVVQLLSLFIEHDFRYKGGNTLTMIAADLNKINIVEFLSEREETFNSIRSRFLPPAKNDLGQTAHDIAVEKGHHDVAKCLDSYETRRQEELDDAVLDIMPQVKLIEKSILGAKSEERLTLKQMAIVMHYHMQKNGRHTKRVIACGFESVIHCLFKFIESTEINLVVFYRSQLERARGILDNELDYELPHHIGFKFEKYDDKFFIIIADPVGYLEETYNLFAKRLKEFCNKHRPTLLASIVVLVNHTRQLYDGESCGIMALKNLNKMDVPCIAKEIMTSPYVIRKLITEKNEGVDCYLYHLPHRFMTLVQSREGFKRYCKDVDVSTYYRLKDSKVEDLKQHTFRRRASHVVTPKLPVPDDGKGEKNNSIDHFCAKYRCVLQKLFPGDEKGIGFFTGIIQKEKATVILQDLDARNLKIDRTGKFVRAYDEWLAKKRGYFSHSEEPESYSDGFEGTFFSSSPKLDISDMEVSKEDFVIEPPRPLYFPSMDVSEDIEIEIAPNVEMAKRSLVV